MSTGVFVRALLGLLGSAVVASPVLAADLFTADVGVQDFSNGCGNFVFDSNFHGASAGVACPGAGAAAIATPGHVGVGAHVSTDGNGIVDAFATYDTEVTFQAQQGQGNQPIEAQLNLDFGGAMGLAGSANVGYGVMVTFNGAQFSRDTSLITGGFPTHGSLDLGFAPGAGGEVDNQLSAFIGGTLRTPKVLVPVGQAVPVELFITISGFGNPGTLNALFLNSLDFAHGQDVFTLPDGYTAEDPDGFIFDNRYLPPGGAPEPAAWGLMIAGFGLAGSALRLRRRAALA